MDRSSPEHARQREIRRLRGELEANGFPRLKMMLLVGLTGGSGFVASFFLLRGGLTSMTVRYPLAVGIAYLFFLFLLWLWLRTKAEDYDELPEPDFSGSRCSSPCQHDGPLDAGDLGGSGLGDVVEAAGSAEELAIPLLALIAAAALVFATGWIVYSAPLLFAELLVDGVLAASLYRRLKGLETRHWLETAIRRTFLPFLITGLTCWASGAVMQQLAPEAHSLGEFIHRNGA